MQHDTGAQRAAMIRSRVASVCNATLARRHDTHNIFGELQNSGVTVHTIPRIALYVASYQREGDVQASRCAMGVQAGLPLHLRCGDLLAYET